MNKLNEKKLFLLDMDGTIYLDDVLIPGTIEFLELLTEQNINYVFLTNNSSKNKEQYLEKLKRLGIKATVDNLFTSSQATAIYLKSLKPKASLFVVGTNALKNELTSEGFKIVETENEKVDYLVIGYDTELDYRKLEIAVHLLNQGVDYIATNPDLVCPAKNEQYLPDCGSICNMLKTATNREPFYIGKPRREMIEIIIRAKKAKKEDVVIIGDRLYTDIACGLNAGITSALVLSGETKKNDLLDSPHKPDYVFNSVYDLYLQLK